MVADLWSWALEAPQINLSQNLLYCVATQNRPWVSKLSWAERELEQTPVLHSSDGKCKKKKHCTSASEKACTRTLAHLNTLGQRVVPQLVRSLQFGRVVPGNKYVRIFDAQWTLDAQNNITFHEIFSPHFLFDIFKTFRYEVDRLKVLILVLLQCRRNGTMNPRRQDPLSAVNSTVYRPVERAIF